MFIGHYGVALGAKRAATRTSLGTLILAAEFVDELWPILLLLGVERVRIVPGLMAATPLDFVHYPLTHSLLMEILWAILFGVAYFAIRRYRAGAWIVGAAVVSHWFLDLLVHRPDLPLWPGSPIRVGLGLWNSVPITLVLEFGIFIAGLALYLGTTRARDRIGSWGLWSMAAALVIFFLAGTYGPPPPSEHALAVTTLVLWIFVPWGYWIDRHRAPGTAVGAPPAPEARPHRGLE